MGSAQDVQLKTFLLPVLECVQRDPLPTACRSVIEVGVHPDRIHSHRIIFIDNLTKHLNDLGDLFNALLFDWDSVLLVMVFLMSGNVMKYIMNRLEEREEDIFLCD